MCDPAHGTLDDPEFAFIVIDDVSRQERPQEIGRAREFLAGVGIHPVGGKECQFVVGSE